MPLNACADCQVKDGQDKHPTGSMNEESELVTDIFICAKYEDKAARDLR